MTKQFLLLFFCLSISVQAQKTLKLWPKGAPNAIPTKSYKEETQYDAQGIIKGVSKVSVPEITVFEPEEHLKNGTSILILPGGGYTHLAINKEGFKVAKWLNTLGITAIVLKYRMPADVAMDNKTIGPLQDAQEAIRYLRANATNYKIDAQKIGVLGFSAGGHLASTLSTQFDKQIYTSSYNVSAKPDFSILIYPVITLKDDFTHKGSKNALLGENPTESVVENFSGELQVTKNTPPTLLVHATNDKAVPVENSIHYYNALRKANVPAEL